MVDERETPVPDIMAKGLVALTHGTTGASPLEEFNDQFERLCERQKLVPVSKQSQAIAASLVQALATVEPSTQPHNTATTKSPITETPSTC